MIRLEVPERKLIRSLVIKKHLENNPQAYTGIVIFSCGNASETLKKVLPPEMFILDIAPNGMLAPTEYWWSMKQIKEVWPTYFDATSGHISYRLIVEMSKMIEKEPEKWLSSVPQRGINYSVATGSGETILALRWAFPQSGFIPVYNISDGTKYNKLAPLNKLVQGEKDD